MLDVVPFLYCCTLLCFKKYIVCLLSAIYCVQFTMNNIIVLVVFGSHLLILHMST